MFSFGPGSQRATTALRIRGWICLLLLGVFEAPCYPANSRILSNWFPQSERARATGYEVVDDKALPGHERVFIFDPFGNRLEFLKPVEGEG